MWLEDGSWDFPALALCELCQYLERRRMVSNILKYVFIDGQNSLNIWSPLKYRYNQTNMYNMYIYSYLYMGPICSM